MLSLGFIVRNPNENTDITNGFISKSVATDREREKKNAMLQLQGAVFLEIFREPHWIERLHKSNNGIFLFVPWKWARWKTNNWMIDARINESGCKLTKK